MIWLGVISVSLFSSWAFLKQASLSSSRIFCISLASCLIFFCIIRLNANRISGHDDLSVSTFGIKSLFLLDRVADELWCQDEFSSKSIVLVGRHYLFSGFSGMVVFFFESAFTGGLFECFWFVGSSQLWLATWCFLIVEDR